MKSEAFGSADRASLNAALNEATWVGITVNSSQHTLAVLMDVLALPNRGPVPAESPVVITLHGVSRIVASLRNGRWDDTTAQAVPLGLDDLDDAVRSFGGSQVYGWESIDPPESSWSRWRDRTSLDVTIADASATHMLELFQDGGDRHFDLRVWFERISFGTPTGDAISLADFSSAGRRWWDGLYAGDPRTGGKGIVPM